MRALTSWLSSVREDQHTQEMVVMLQSRVYRALAGAHWDTIRRLAPPRITSALQTQTYDAVYGFSAIVQVATATLLIGGYLLSTAFVFPLLLPGLLAILAAMWVLNRRRSGHVQTHAEDYVEATTELHQRYEDWVAISRLTSLGMDAGLLAGRFEADSRGAAAHAVSYARSRAATQMSYQLALIAGLLVGVPIAWYLETPPALLVFGLLAFIRILPRAAGIQVAYQEIVKAVAPLQAVERLAAELESDPVAPHSAEARIDWQSFELKDVSIAGTTGLDERRQIVRDVSLEFKRGEWLALSGPTGAGKTTIADTMLMLLRPESGSILIDGKEVDESLASAWRHQAAYVPQDVVLFDATIRENLRVLAPDSTDDDFTGALHMAAADFVTERLPDGLDTRVGPGGRWLSGGERQRIGIARALLRKPGLLVLDEPTAALDEGTQSMLMKALSELDHSMSLVLISHRPELLALADRVIDVEDGRIKA